MEALEKISIFLRDKGRDQWRSVSIGDGGKDNIAVRTAIRSLVSQVKVYREVLVELAQLAVDIIADDEGVTTAEKLPQGQTTIAREQPSVLAYGPSD